jgi:hypothetical protein
MNSTMTSGSAPVEQAVYTVKQAARLLGKRSFQRRAPTLDPPESGAGSEAVTARSFHGSCERLKLGATYAMGSHGRIR